MRIVHITTQVPRRAKTTGAALALHQLASTQASSGHQVVLASPEPPSGEHSYGWMRLPFGRLPRPIRWVLFPVSLHFRRWDFDVAVVHGEDWFWVVRSLPTVRVMYGSAAAEAEFATSVRRRYSQRVLGQLERLSKRLATVTLGITAGSSDKERVLPLGFDESRFAPGKKTAAPTVLFVGTWEGRKRGKLAYDTVDKLRKDFPELKFTMVCADAPDGIDATVVEFADDDELAELYRSSWVLLHPSRYEGFGLPYLEAMASGTAVVSSPNPGAVMLLVPGGQQIVEDEGLLEAVSILLRDRDARREQELAGIEFARGRTWAAAGRQLTEWCRKVLSRGERDVTN